MSEPPEDMKHRPPGWMTPTILIVLIVAAMIYLAMSGEKRLHLNCDADTPGVTAP